MVHSVEGHFPVQKEQEKRLACLMEELLGPIHYLNRCLGRFFGSKTVLCVPKQRLHEVGDTSVEHFSKQLVQGVQKGDRLVVAREGVVPFLKDAGYVSLFPRLRYLAIRPATVNKFKNIRAVEIIKVH